MKIHEVIIESQQDIDEISLRGVGQAVAKGAKAVGKGIGGLAGGTVGTAKQFGQGVAQGWQQGISTTTGAGQRSSATQTSPRSAGSSTKTLNKDSLKKIKDLIANLNTQQKQYLLTALANKSNQPKAPAPAVKPTTMATAPVSKRNVPKPTNPNLKSAPATPAGAFGQMASSLVKP